MYFCFLDIDGVLNHHLYYEKESQSIKHKKEGILGDISKESVKILNNLHEDYPIYYVISSTWRNGKTIQELQEMLDSRGFTGIVVGKTPSFRWISKEWDKVSLRGNEIFAWMQKFAKDNNYVIYDDDSDMLLWQKDNYFQIDGYCGITPNIIYRSLRFLTKQK